MSGLTITAAATAPGPAGVRADRGQSRRAGARRLLTGLVLLAAAAGFYRAGDRPPVLLPPETPATAAVYRPDGGQALGGAGKVKINALTELNLGRQIRLGQTSPELLAALPAFGRQSALTAVDSGCLNNRQRRQLEGMIIETCTRTKP